MKNRNSRTNKQWKGSSKRWNGGDEMIVMVARQMGTTDKVKNAEEKKKGMA